VTATIHSVNLRPSGLATFLRQTESWTGSLDAQWLRIADGTQMSLRQIANVEVQRHLLWSDVVVSDHHQQIVLTGLGHAAASQVEERLLALIREAERQAGLLRDLRADGPRIVEWWGRFIDTMNGPHWVTREHLKELEASRPGSRSGPRLVECWSLPDLAGAIAVLPREWAQAIEGWARTDVRAWAAERNETLLRIEKVVMADWFDTIEKSPLTDEQVEAVVRFDNRTRVIAAAGSGKTSTMVAKAAYAIARGVVQPNEILMLAFNNEAAKELRDRTAARLPHGVVAPEASTFHAFGLRVIGEATGRKPHVADDVVNDGGRARLLKIVDRLREDSGFRRDWDLFRLVFGRPLARVDQDEEPDVESRDESGFKTLMGEIVRSRGEVMIANWLWYHGVDYEYERPYEHDVADAHHGQYRPDFFYPELCVYHEHWALDEHGNPPPSFEGYGEGMAWKQKLHRQYGTTLLETTTAGIADGSGFDDLEHQLIALGAHLDEAPYRDVPGEPPIRDDQLLQLVRTFMVHLKSNRLDPARLPGVGIRAKVFLRLVEPIVRTWDAELRQAGLIDFEDMINEATDLIRSGTWTSPYRLVMVDEMQDTSVARANLVLALLKQDRHSYLYAVGDDWQSINRFAGSDLSVMSRFEDWFGPADTCYLSHTFRSPQSLCDVASAFVSANPSQLPKKVVSHRSGAESTVHAIAVTHWKEYAKVIADHLQALDSAAGAPTTVLLLGRYKKDGEDVARFVGQRGKHLTVSFDTVHRSKGKEADHVVVLNLCRKLFPSTIEDDPLLELAMPAEEAFPFAEERRLLYVAMTRARQSVLLLTQTRQESPFLLELVLSGQVPLRRAGEDEPVRICTTCRRGTVTRRVSKYGPFLSCSRYPLCTWKSSGN
jgi:DNA helicase IV